MARVFSVTRPIEIADAIPQEVADRVQQQLQQVMAEIPDNIQLTLFQHTLTPIRTITENSGSDSMGAYDYHVTHVALLLTVIAMWIE